MFAFGLSPLVNGELSMINWLMPLGRLTFSALRITAQHHTQPTWYIIPKLLALPQLVHYQHCGQQIVTLVR